MRAEKGEDAERHRNNLRGNGDSDEKESKRDRTDFRRDSPRSNHARQANESPGGEKR